VLIWGAEGEKSLLTGKQEWISEGSKTGQILMRSENLRGYRCAGGTIDAMASSFPCTTPCPSP
jgi:hypothetical protein